MIGSNTVDRHGFGSPKLRPSSVFNSGLIVIVATSVITMSCQVMASDRDRSEWMGSKVRTDEQTVTTYGFSESDISHSEVSDPNLSEHQKQALPSRRIRKNVRTVAQAAFSAEDETSVRPVTNEVPPIPNSESLPTNVAEQGSKAFIDLSGPAESFASVTPPSAVAASTMDQVRLGAWMLILFCGMVLAVLAMRRWKRNQGLLTVNGKTSRVVETLSLGPGRSVSLIEIAGMRALVGADAGGIRTIVMAPRSFDDEIRENDFEDFPARETLSERSTALQR